MKKHLFLIAALSFGMAACTTDVLTPEDNAENISPDQENKSILKKAKLASIASDQSRVIYELGTRAEGEEETTMKPGELKLISTIANPDNEVFGSYANGDKRFMSATCVYYDQVNEQYYVTYHMQGNNYNTQLDDDIAGAIQIFKISDDGEIELDDIICSADRSQLDFDFNHLYIDNLWDYSNCGTYNGSDTGTRLIAVGHISKPGKDNTQAMIAKINIDEKTIEYTPVFTGDKVTDLAGASL